MGELRLRLFDFNTMPYYEFKLKSFAFHRERTYNTEMQMILTRKIVMSGYWGYNGDPKRFPSIETEVFKTSFDDDIVVRVNEATKEQFLLELQEYNNRGNIN